MARKPYVEAKTIGNIVVLKFQSVEDRDHVGRLLLSGAGSYLSLAIGCPGASPRSLKRALKRANCPQIPQGSEESEEG